MTDDEQGAVLGTLLYQHRALPGEDFLSKGEPENDIPRSTLEEVASFLHKP
eukprot:CAMPEP_0181465682 /NCGR_PEP_ID=MMETSP1110-20121109/36075_1 /TAXON_ID=174948 /ORGANISM="Symbiodinium sp., Strain CCMP421" /LENGTH=50 /DNA_ID=CAMNT_0023590457 /DNA_START=336 /DNA_END=488 /DNA_ORIENTATION=+